MTELAMTITVKLPWWWRLYVGSLMLMDELGMLHYDPDVAGEFIVQHTKIYLGGRRI